MNWRTRQDDELKIRREGDTGRQAGMHAGIPSYDSQLTTRFSALKKIPNHLNDPRGKSQQRFSMEKIVACLWIAQCE